VKKNQLKLQNIEKFSRNLVRYRFDSFMALIIADVGISCIITTNQL